MMDNTLEINPQIIHENLDGEVIIINLTTGIYFSMNIVGAQIWTLIEKKQSIQSIIKNIAAMYNEEIPTIQPALEDFFQRLETFKLVTKNPSEIEFSSSELSNPILFQNLSKFVPPILEQYQDMQEMLLLDPIHDVDETSGWPHQK